MQRRLVPVATNNTSSGRGCAFPEGGAAPDVTIKLEAILGTANMFDFAQQKARRIVRASSAKSSLRRRVACTCSCACSEAGPILRRISSRAESPHHRPCAGQAWSRAGRRCAALITTNNGPIPGAEVEVGVPSSSPRAALRAQPARGSRHQPERAWEADYIFNDLPLNRAEASSRSRSYHSPAAIRPAGQDDAGLQRADRFAPAWATILALAGEEGRLHQDALSSAGALIDLPGTAAPPLCLHVFLSAGGDGRSAATMLAPRKSGPTWPSTSRCRGALCSHERNLPDHPAKPVSRCSRATCSALHDGWPVPVTKATRAFKRPKLTVEPSSRLGRFLVMTRPKPARAKSRKSKGRWTELEGDAAYRNQLQGEP